jgi:hypothetical protein
MIEAIDSVEDLNHAREILFSRQNGKSIFCGFQVRRFFRYFSKFLKTNKKFKIDIIRELLVFEIQAQDYEGASSYKTNFFFCTFNFLYLNDSFDVILDCIEFIKFAFKDDPEAMETLLLSQDEFGNSCLHYLLPEYHELHKFKDALKEFPDILEKLFSLRNLEGKLYSE